MENIPLEISNKETPVSYPDRGLAPGKSKLVVQVLV